MASRNCSPADNRLHMWRGPPSRATVPAPAAADEPSATAAADEPSAPASADESSAPASADESSAPASADESSAPASADESSAPASADESSAPASADEPPLAIRTPPSLIRRALVALLVSPRATVSAASLPGREECAGAQMIWTTR
ncbi:testis-specific gene A8 protein-like [Rhipicephalus sanguineus]|uniref:testis-specific gene A8 protein-like n=1 Tax=Rhipicephalus sanguineus TaxID=34632 RepID=UPI0020C4DA17|nr:testis-specific gene A8 protein-like [Rhipicephalus sanguineus]